MNHIIKEWSVVISLTRLKDLEEKENKLEKLMYWEDKVLYRSGYGWDREEREIRGFNEVNTEEITKLNEELDKKEKSHSVYKREVKGFIKKLEQKHKEELEKEKSKKKSCILF